MTKIYEALQNAGKKRVDDGSQSVTMPPAAPVRSGRKIPRSLEEKLLTLYRRIEAMFEDKRCRVVQFAGVQASDDSSKLICEFASLVASRLRRKVLLLAATPSGYVRRLAPDAGGEGWEDILDNGRAVGEVVHQAGDSTLAVGQMAASETSLPSVLSSPKLGSVFDELRHHFDIVLVDAPPLGPSWDAVLLSPVMDGVVLVVQANRTRWQVVRDSIEQIEAQRGRVFGTLLNRQRHYIPSFIYRRLL